MSRQDEYSLKLNEAKVAIKKNLDLAKKFDSEGKGDKQYKALCIAAVHCYESNHPDSDLVADILRQIFGMDSEYYFEFLDPVEAKILDLKPRRGRYKKIRWHLELEFRRIHVLEYFMSHCCKAKAIFRGFHFVNEFAMFNIDLPLLQLVLRYETRDRPDLFAYLVNRLVKKLADCYVLEDMEAFKETEDKLKAVARTVSRVPKEALDFTIYREGHVYMKAEDFVLKLIHEGKLGFMVLSYVQPPSLKHLCRIQVRKMLNENSALPLEIRELPLPNTLMVYLDILGPD